MDLHYEESEKESKQNINSFLDSLDTLTADDIAEPVPSQKKALGDVIVLWVRRALLAVCLVVLVISGSYLIRSVIDAKITNDKYGQLADEIWGNTDSHIGLMVSPTSPVTPDFESCQSMTPEDFQHSSSSSALNADYERMKSRLTLLKQQYPNLYGWIHVDGTVIDYPIMQAKDNDYYLNHHYDGTTSIAGSLFADFHCNPSINLNFNTVIYGHHMSSSRSMFRDIDFFFEEDFFRDHDTIVVYTLDGAYTYKIFAIYQTNMYYKYIRTGFSSGAEFLQFAREMQQNSVFKRDGISFSEISRIITLSTCDNRTTGGRFCLQGVLVDVVM